MRKKRYAVDAFKLPKDLDGVQVGEIISGTPKLL